MSYKNQPVTITASTTLNRNSHMDTCCVLNALAGLTVTLPASAGKGDVYEVFVLTLPSPRTTTSSRWRTRPTSSRVPST
jgi:hypothetical protein